jgi:para-aminobenzoate synthetase/4-amino-4-deoxychorismate lyase
MKGTAPRGRTTQEDRAQAGWLRNDPKNRAENVMIVDLLRNDLGRISTFGSVHTRDLFAVERYPTLWQMTSTVTGELRPGIGFQQIFRALFPCGSITGAPKVRTMQLISQLEQRPRGVYTGAIGFFSREQSIFNVAIRTLELDGSPQGHTGVMGVGGGIVIDSDPAEEFCECLLKAQFLSSARHCPSPGAFSLIESLLCHANSPAAAYPLLNLHLDRLQDSAAYFDFPFDRAEIASALHVHFESQTSPPATDAANSLTRYPGEAGANLPPQSGDLKVRLLLNRDGDIHIEDELLATHSGPPAGSPLRVRIATQRTDPQDSLYFHKTTHRPLYTEALQSAIQAGYDDVLFLNLRGEVTEGARHNIFVEKDGRLLTPPVSCGLLAGVHRRHILETQPNAAEAILTLEDLLHASAIYLSNAVRGLRPAVIDWQSASTNH